MRQRMKANENSRSGESASAEPQQVKTEVKSKLRKRKATVKRCPLHPTFICPLRPARRIGTNTSGPISTFVIGVRCVSKPEVERSRTIEDGMQCGVGCPRSAWTTRKSGKAGRPL